MKIIHLSEKDISQSKQVSPCTLAVGFFDGIHRGHQRVILTAKRKAVELGIQSAVMTFDPHPSVVLNHSVKHAKYITPLAEKERILNNAGIDTLFVVHFDKSLASLSPEQFVEKFFVSQNVQHVVAGFDFTFGFKGKGTMKLLPEYARARFTTTTIEQVSEDGEKVSSTRIRDLLAEGDIALVNRLLDRPYRITGEVVTGDRRGRTIGYPTANLSLNSEYYMPKAGVYAVKVIIANQEYKGMANLGFKPTFNDGKVKNLEIHIFDFNQDVYGQEIAVDFYRHIRSEEKFNGVDELISQLKNDEVKSREILASL
ncbi:riboflavin biosynthesis protein [Halobacillus andaensis]|uniref:Riboflavin biosynthesis protein n=1 Tax=Halobacillus andaensis TaxID=1176239 RepID=A0A917AYI5_HALAA|nr:bifunctional riboflavin kinase/FAD synthetase [Halobacillus andaensis]MBP2003450.1 riboflavin kinase/FMN adenylyltransferase [Halobacillus andaensis]GGF10671.1 riboflavin biosynthesis protein [Halobacillus andaensis]